MIPFFIIIGIFFFLLLQSFFSLSEIAFVSTNSLRLQKRKEKNKKAYTLEQILSNPERFLSTILIGSNISIIISTTLLTYLLIKIGIKNSNIWVTTILTPLVVIFAEIIPKNIGRYYQEDVAVKIANFFKVLEAVLYPLGIGAEKAAFFFSKIFLKRKKESFSFLAKEEIKALIEEAEKEGGLEKGEKEAIEDIFDFTQKKVKDICVPLKKICGIEAHTPPEKIKEKIRKFKFTRLPIFSQNKIIGYLNIFDLFYRKEVNLKESIRPISFVGASQKLYEVFNLLKNKKESIAVVVKGKKILGIVTLEDIMREILISISK